MRFRAGMFDAAATVPYKSIGIDVMNNADGKALALQAATEAIVLLKNDGNILPFSPAAMKGKTLAVVGPVANSSAIMMGGKSDYCPEHTVSLCEGIAARAAAAGVTVNCVPTGGPDDIGVGVDGGSSHGGASDEEVAAAVQGADAVVIAVGGIFGHEGSDRKNISLPQDQITFIYTTAAAAAAASKPVVLLLVNGDPIALDGIKDAIPAIVDVFEGGQSGGTAAASILFGDTSPSGMMPFTTYPDAYVTKVTMSDMSMRQVPNIPILKN